MKKTWKRIAAVLLAVVMCVTGMTMVPEVNAEAADNIPTFTVKVSSATVKPGDKVTVEFWLNPGADTISVAGFFNIDKNVYSYRSRDIQYGDLYYELDDKGMMPIISIDESGDGLLVLLVDEEPMKNGGHIATITLTVKDDAAGSGNISFDCAGAEVGPDGDNAEKVPEAEVTAPTIDASTGEVIQGGNLPVIVDLESLNIEREDFTMAKGTTDVLSVVGTPEAGLVGKTIEWKSSNNEVVTVDQEGNIKAVGIGEATITATADGKSDSVTITVNAPLNAITLNKTELTLKKGTSETLSVNYDPADTTDDKTVVWDSSNKTVATVDKTGKVTALKDGETTVTATVGKHIAECIVTVQEVKLTGISLSEEQLSLNKGESSEALTVIYDPENTTDDKTVTWTSDNANIATVKDGVVTAKAAGKTTVTAQVGEYTADCQVEVNSKLTGITITPDKDTTKLEAGDIVNIAVSYNPEDTTDTKEIEWTSENENVATVENGVVTAVAGGTTKVTATSKANETITAECMITVLKHTTGISLDKQNMELTKGEVSAPLVVTFDPEDTDDSKEIKWTSDDKNVATVDSNGKVTALKEGTAVITAETVDGKHTATCTVTVKEIHVTDAVLDAKLNPASLYKGQSHTLKVTLTPENTTDKVTYTYESSDKEVADVSADGVVKALKEGKAEIKVTVKANNFEKELVYKVEVKEIPLEKIAIKEKVTPIEEGKTAQLSVIFNPENTTDDKNVEWISSDTSVATIKNGLITAIKPGKTTITAKVGDMTDSYELTVVAKKAPEDTNKNEQDKKPTEDKAVQTGDNSNILGIMVTMLLALAVIMTVVVFKGKIKRVHR